MLIDAKETQALADMLHIGLSPEDAARLAGDMSAVLKYAKALDKVDVTGVEPMTVGVGGYTPLREDVPGPSLDIADLESLSGGRFDVQTGAFVTKPVFQ